MPETPKALRNLTARFIYLLIVATVGPLLFGFHLAELNAPQDIITCVKKSFAPTSYLSPLPQCIPMTSLEIGVVSSIFTIGGLIGALVAGSSASRYGRLNTMRYTTGFFTVGPLFEATASNVGLMAVGRLISGIGAGAAVVVAPIYISEIAPTQQKGFFGSFTQIMINMGIFIAQLLGLFLSRGQLWRVILGVGGIIGLNQLAALFFAFESPKWLADHGHPGRARNVLQRIRGSGYDIKEEVEGWGVEDRSEMNGEEDALLNEEDHPSSPRSDSSSSSSKKPDLQKDTIGLFKIIFHPNYTRAISVVVVIMVSQQLCGINSIVMYGVSLLSDLLTTSSSLLNVFVALLNLVATVAFAPLIDRLGRKTCLAISAAGMGTSSLLLAIAIGHHIPLLAATSVLTFVAAFAIGIGPIPFLISSELVGPEAVGATQSLALAANWLATFVVAQFFPVLNEKFGKGRIYYVFAGVAAAFMAFVWFCVPETKDKKDSDEVWGRTESTREGTLRRQMSRERRED